MSLGLLHRWVTGAWWDCWCYRVLGWAGGMRPGDEGRPGSQTCWRLLQPACTSTALDGEGPGGCCKRLMLAARRHLALPLSSALHAPTHSLPHPRPHRRPTHWLVHAGQAAQRAPGSRQERALPPPGGPCGHDDPWQRPQQPQQRQRPQQAPDYRPRHRPGDGAVGCCCGGGCGGNPRTFC